LFCAMGSVTPQTKFIMEIVLEVSLRKQNCFL
jgi:hypothetical protein